MNDKILISTVVLPIMLFANKPAIETLNYNISSSYNTSNIGKRINIGGNIRIPVANYFEIGLSTNISSFNGKNTYSDSDAKSAGFNLIFRDSSIGKIETSYNYTSTKHNIESVSLNSKSKLLNINATYYFNDFDFLINRSQSKSTNDTYDSFNGKGTENSTSYDTYTNISYYINNNLNISTGKRFNKSYKTNLNISYQPEKFSNLLEIDATYTKDNKRLGISYNHKSFKYSLSHSTYNSTYNFSISYTFNRVHSIKDRIRKY